MRAWIAGLALLAAPAMAQQSLDGKASLSGRTADILRYSAQPLSKEAVRSLISVYINKQPGEAQTPEERDFFAELASGRAVETTIPDKVVMIAPLVGEPLHDVNLLITPPNLNTLWKQNGEPAKDMLEIARWGERGRGRVVQYIANMLYGAWSRSSVQNGYAPWMDEWLGGHNAFERVADAEDMKRARLLLKDAMVQVFAKCKADGREPPPKFLYDVQLASVGVPMP